MARPGIEKDDVKRAMEELGQRGDAVTLAAIRNLLGTGSMTTIRRFRNELRDEETDKSVPRHDIPKELETAFGDTLAGLWHLAEKLAASEIENIREAAAREAAQQKSDTEQLCDAYDQATRTIEELKTERSTLQSRCEELEKELVARSAEKLELEARYDALLARFEAEMEPVRSLLETLQKRSRTSSPKTPKT